MGERSTTVAVSLARTDHDITRRRSHVSGDSSVDQGGHGLQHWKPQRHGEHIVIGLHLGGSNLLVHPHNAESAQNLHHRAPI